MHITRILIIALALISPSILSGMQLPALVTDEACGDAIINVITASACANYFNKDWETLARKIPLTQAIQEAQALLSSHESLANDIALNEKIVSTLAHAFRFSPEFNTTAGFGNRNCAKKCLIGLRLGTPGAHLWVANESNHLISSVLLNWETADKTHIDTKIVLAYARTIQSSHYRSEFKENLGSLWSHFFLGMNRLSIVSIETVKLFIKMGIDINKPLHGTIDDMSIMQNRTPLMQSCLVGGRLEDITRALLDSGADVNAQNKEGGTALLFAILSGKRSLSHIQLLLERGANINNNFTAYELDVSPEIRELLMSYAIKRSPGNIAIKLRNRELGKKS